VTGATSVSPWHQGTLHHFFDGGWLWVIPFDNHADSRNRLCSVGLNLDNHRAPPATADPEEEWRRVLARHPAIAAQFADARPVRPWVTTGRVQYSSTRCVGDRFWMTPHAAGAVDALYSMGNINTFQAVAAAVPAILSAFREREFTAARFAGLQRLTDNLLRFQDRVVFGSYVAMRDPALLDTWLAVWALTDTARIREVLIPLVRFLRTGNDSDLAFNDAHPDRIFTGLGHCTGVEDTVALLDRLDSWCDVMQALAEGRASVDETATRLRQSVQAAEPYNVDLDLMSRALGAFPWTYAPLNRNGLRAYGAAFLTADELNSIGIPGADRNRTPAP
jgi:FADH2 O2-dependent halogenase